MLNDVRIRAYWKKRRQNIYKDYLKLKSYNKVARKYKLSTSRIGQIISRERKYVGKTED